MGNSWAVWGDESVPIARDLTKEAAKAKADELTKLGRKEVYAEDFDSGETYEP